VAFSEAWILTPGLGLLKTGAVIDEKGTMDEGKKNKESREKKKVFRFKTGEQLHPSSPGRPEGTLGQQGHISLK